MAPAPPANIPRVRVLVADDNADARESLCLLLTLWGYQPVEAADGAQAVEAARTLLPAAALLDLAMPQLDGYAAARQIRRLPGMEGSLLVAVSGYGRDEDVRRAIREGFDHFVLKPYRPAELRNLLDSAGLQGPR